MAPAIMIRNCHHTPSMTQNYTIIIYSINNRGRIVNIFVLLVLVSDSVIVTPRGMIFIQYTFVR